MSDPILSRGSTGAAVVSLQQGLNLFEGFDFAVSGTYDNTTEAAVAKFQQMAGILVDGVCGQQTWDALRAAVQQLQSQQPAPSPDTVVEMDPVTVTGNVGHEAPSNTLLYLGLAAAGGYFWWRSLKKKGRAGPGQPVMGDGAHDQDDESHERSQSHEDRARATRRRMRRNEMIFGPDPARKRPSGGTQMKNSKRKGKVRPFAPSDTTEYEPDEDLWMTQSRGAPRSATPLRHGVAASTFKANPEHFRTWARDKAARENRVVFVVDQKNGRVLYRTGSEPSLSGRKPRRARRPRLADAVTTRLLDEPAEVASSGTPADCEKAAQMLSKRKMLAAGEHDRAHFKRVVRAVAEACRGEAAEAIERVVEHEIERREEIEEDMPPPQSRMKKGQSAQMTLLTDMLDTASRRREGKPGAASHIERRGKKRIKRTRQIDNSKAKGYRWRRAELPDERDPREGPSKGRPTIKETRGKQGERGWRKEKWFGPREGPRRPKGD